MSGKEQKKKLLQIYFLTSSIVLTIWLLFIIIFWILYYEAPSAANVVHTIELCFSCLIYIISGLAFMVVGYKVARQFSRYTQSILYQKNEFASSQGHAIAKRIGVLAAMFTGTLIIKSLLTLFIYFYFFNKKDFSENDILVNIVIRVINQILFEFAPCLFSFIYLYKPISSSKNVRYNKITVNN